MEFIGSTFDLNFDDQSGWAFGRKKKSPSQFGKVNFNAIPFFSSTGDAELQDNSLFASSNNSYVSFKF